MSTESVMSMQDDALMPVPALGSPAAERLPILPVSVLDARAHWWTIRRRRWRALIGGGGESREAVQASGSLQASAQRTGTAIADGGSRFDPVLAEIVMRWWCPPGGLVLDPFAGGATRGMVAAHLGLRYIGVDIRTEQVEANRAEARDQLPAGLPTPTWLVGDARQVDGMDIPPADLIFTCPPYADLERYSDDPADLSTLPAAAFRGEHAIAVSAAARCLLPDRFAVWVMGEARSSSGSLYGLVLDTIRAMTDAGLIYATEAIMVTPLGNAHVRAPRPFAAARTLTRAHQTVLIGCAGDRSRAAAAAGAPTERTTR